MATAPLHIPPALLQQLQPVAGFDEQSFLAAHAQPAVTSVRLHPVKHTGRFDTEAKVPWCNTGRYLQERPVFTLDPLYHAGAYYVQEASSMFLHHMLTSLLPERDNLRVLDLCAAPGGKSTLIASVLGKNSLLLSNEVIRSRASILEENMTRWGYMNTWVCSNDPRDIGKLRGYFDVIVVDAPCSGSGLFRKDARALDEWSEANVQLCSERQHRILADVWPALKENGMLIYATCSYSPQEDEQVLDWVATNFEAKSLAVAIDDSWGIVPVTSGQHMQGYRFFPGKVNGEGFFIAAFQKQSAEDAPRVPKFKTQHDKKAYEQSAFLLNEKDLLCIKTADNEFSALVSAHETDMHILKQFVYLRRTGLPLGSPTAKEWLPSHDVALSIDKAVGIQHIDVNKEAALRFLKKEDMQVGDMPKGWLLVRYEGMGLGWVKSLGNRFNNYLPKHWRIRMDISDADWA